MQGTGGTGVPRSEPAVVAHFPRESQHFSPWQKLSPVWWFRNADEPVAPDWYRPGQCCRSFRYHLRNPCHNFHFYVIGLVDKPFTRVGRFPGSIGNPNGGWNWAVCRYKRLRLPFLDYKHGRFEFYWGWREGGAFGIKLNFAQKQEVPAQRPAERTPPTEQKL